MKMNYNLTDDELKQLSDDELFEYLDAKATHLKQFSEPLGTYQTKHFAAIAKGDGLTNEELKRVKEIGKIGDDYRSNKILEASAKMGKNPKVEDPGGANIKTHRSQWFD